MRATTRKDAFLPQLEYSSGRKPWDRGKAENPPSDDTLRVGKLSDSIVLVVVAPPCCPPTGDLKGIGGHPMPSRFGQLRKRLHPHRARGTCCWLDVGPSMGP
ncbi:hypothetical protein ACCO45_011324 [Purpureocillium lilacinum]|uniref:Uncharacterized protein n=1 Tax=Purpureocillium lilacinum TaxID=33203 RepID=A0ACC4DHR7_PURLI